MRGVCKTWLQGFKLGVQSIAIVDRAHPVLPSGIETSRRFPGLTKLDLGGSSTNTAWLGTLRALPKLSSLILGNTGRRLHSKMLSCRLVDVDMVHLQVCAESPTTRSSQCLPKNLGVRIALMSLLALWECVLAWSWELKKIDFANQKYRTSYRSMNSTKQRTLLFTCIFSTLLSLS